MVPASRAELERVRDEAARAIAEVPLYAAYPPPPAAPDDVPADEFQVESARSSTPALTVVRPV